MSEIGESVTVIEASTGTVLSTHKISSKPSPAKSAPVEIMFSPKTDAPVVHITNMMEGTLWAGVWDPASKTFSFHQVDDFGPREQGMPLEVLYNAKGDRLFVTTAKPGSVNLYDNRDPRAAAESFSAGHAAREPVVLQVVLRVESLRRAFREQEDSQAACPYSLGMRMVLIIKLPERAKSSDNGCRSQGPMVQPPQ